MKLGRRVLIIMGKGLKLCCLMVLMRCFGAEATAHMVTSADVIRHRVSTGCRFFM
jgi:hypothetical protein